MDCGVFGPDGVYAQKHVAMGLKQGQETAFSAVPPFLGVWYTQGIVGVPTRKLKIATTGNVLVCWQKKLHSPCFYLFDPFQETF